VYGPAIGPGAVTGAALACQPIAPANPSTAVIAAATTSFLIRGSSLKLPTAGMISFGDKRRQRDFATLQLAGPRGRPDDRVDW
jgi:hypothetical protein